MKTKIITLCAAVAIGISAAIIYWPSAGHAAECATCSPAGTCKACSNCKYCGNCAKRGGSCSVCR